MDSALIGTLVAPVVARCGLEVDRIEVLPAGKRKVVRIFLDGDGPAGRGPSLDEIAEATRAISRRLDDAKEIGNAPYTLEVSSRGVSRPLTEAKHYRRNTGRLVTLTMAGEEVTGRIAEVGDDAVRLEVADGTRDVALADVRRAVVQVELNRPGGDDADDSDGFDEAGEEEE
ncbi:MAG: ribosome maturation factor RimP [Micropruina sp.]|nr:MAG: ribosome maturation factor RimP [Micropruina sp.]